MLKKQNMTANRKCVWCLSPFNGLCKDGSEKKRKKFCCVSCREYDKTRRIRYAVIDLLGGRCSTCNNEDKDVLQIDHVRSIKSTGEPRKGTSRVFHRWILAGNTKNLQLLCANCHMKKSVKERRR